MVSRSSSSPRFVWPPWLMPALKVLLHAGLLLPALLLLERFRSGRLALDPDPVNYLTHATGNWALWILLGSLAVTPLRRLHPALAPLVRARRLIGLYAFFYASLHLATYVFLFSGFDLQAALHAVARARLREVAAQWRAVWPTILDDLKRRRFIQVGLLSWTILLLLAATSPLAVLRVLGGRRWRNIHALVYVAAIAAVVHFWWLVKAGNRAPWRDTAVLAALLAVRLLHGARARWSVRSAPRRDRPAV